MTRAEAEGVLLRLLALRPEQRRRAWLALSEPERRSILDEWRWQSHGGQIEPKRAQCGGPWRVWAIVAGRGFGKTRAGSEWVWARARENPGARIALVAASLDEVARVMVGGESGILATARCDERPRWIASRGLLLFPGGAEAHAFSAEKPDKLRGPQHHFAWCDELAKWSRAEETWNNLMLGLRLGERPRTIVTTTPKPVPLLGRILALDSCAATGGRSDENPHLPADFIAAMTEQFGGTRLARQELEGELLDEFEGALWSRALIDKARGGMPGDDFERIVVGLDPPASTGGDSCGIVVCAVDKGKIAWVLADLSAAGLSPDAWARRVADAAGQYKASLVVAEKNQGGDMIASVLRAADADLPVRLVPATRSKAARAEPIALRFETGRARLAGRFPELEDQMCALTWAGYQGPGSPDRLDAMVWAMTELYERARREPRIVAL